MAIFNEIVKSIHAGIEERRFKKRVADHACLVRSLGTITGAQPTKIDYKRRFVDLDQLSVELSDDRLYEITKNQGMKAAVSATVKADMKATFDLIRDLKRTTTPLGNALRSFHIGQEEVKGSDIKQRLERGEQLIIRGYSLKEQSAHFAHLKSDGNHIIAVSDNGVQQDVSGEGIFHILTFKKK